jgi:hypothetical protein
MAASPPEQAIGANDAGFDGFARLHDRKQRHHAAHWKIDPLDWLPRLVQDDIRPTRWMAIRPRAILIYHAATHGA